MTRSVLQSDVEFVKRLMEAGCLDAGRLIPGLCRRGVDQAEAAKLVDYLRNGPLAGLTRDLRVLYACE